MVGKIYEEMAMRLLAQLEKSAFNFYYGNLERDGSLVEEAKNYVLVKQKIIGSFTAPEEPQDIIHQAFEVALVMKDIPRSMKNIKIVYKNDGLDDRVMFELLRSASCNHNKMKQIVPFRGQNNYAGIVIALKTFATIIRPSQDLSPRSMCHLRDY